MDALYAGWNNPISWCSFHESVKLKKVEGVVLVNNLHETAKVRTGYGDDTTSVRTTISYRVRTIYSM